jgi:hypothetical protein
MFATRTETLRLASVALAYSLPRAGRIAPFCTHPRFPSETRIPDFSISRISRTVARVDLSRSVDPYRRSGISRSRVISAFVSDLLLCPTSASNSTISFHRRRRRRRLAGARVGATPAELRIEDASRKRAAINAVCELHGRPFDSFRRAPAVSFVLIPSRGKWTRSREISCQATDVPTRDPRPMATAGTPCPERKLPHPHRRADPLPRKTRVVRFFSPRFSVSVGLPPTLRKRVAPLRSRSPPLDGPWNFGNS